MISNRSDQPELRTDDIEARVYNIDRQIIKLVDLYQVGNIPIDEITSRINKLKKEKDALIASLDNQGHSALSAVESKQILKEAEKIFKGDDIAHKRLIISSLVDFVEIDGKNIITHWRFG